MAAIVPLSQQNAIVQYLAEFDTARATATATATATRRYQAGCIELWSFATRQPTPLFEGAPVYSPAAASLFPPGTVVCDRWGNTGILKLDAIAYDWRSPAGYQYEKGDRLPLIQAIAFTGQIPSDAQSNGTGYLGRVSSR